MPVISGNNFIKVGDTVASPTTFIGDMIPDYVKTWRTWAQDSIQNAEYALYTLRDIADDIDVPIRDVTQSWPTANFSIAIDGEPEARDISFTIDAVPTAPEMPDISGLAIGETPAFSDPGLTYEAPQIPSELTISLPAKPSGLDAGEAPDYQESSAPTKPTWATPQKPKINEVELPTMEEISLPEFSATIPELVDLNFANRIGEYSDPGYTTTLYAEIHAYLTGFEDLILTLSQKLLDQESRANERLRAEVARSSPAGWSYPPGVTSARLVFAEQETQLKLSAGQREIFINETTQLRAWVQDTLAKLIQQDSALMGLYNAQQSRQLEYLVQFTSAALNVYNAMATLYNARARAFEASVTHHKTLLDTELAKLEKYRIEMDAAKLGNEINAQNLGIYQAEWQAIATQVNVYNQEIAAWVSSTLEPYRIKVQAFGEKVRAIATKADIWKAEVQAKVSENEAKRGAFAAHQDGQRAKADFVRANAQVFSEKMQGFRAGIEASKTAIDADVSRLNVLSQTFENQIKAYNAGLDAKARRSASLSQQVSADTAIYQTKLQGRQAVLQADISEYNGLLDKAKSEAQLKIQNAQIQLDAANRQLQSLLSAQQFIAQSYSQLAASTLSAIDIGMSTSEGMSWGWSGSQSFSFSQSETL